MNLIINIIYEYIYYIDNLNSITRLSDISVLYIDWLIHIIIDHDKLVWYQWVVQHMCSGGIRLIFPEWLSADHYETRSTGETVETELWELQLLSETIIDACRQYRLLL